ncbi:MAG: hypothetical protein AAFS07_01645 [Pseudomonadota bacterium]
MRFLLLPLFALAVMSFAAPAMAAGCNYSTTTERTTTDGQTS